jgi:hypothetical protein
MLVLALVACSTHANIVATPRKHDSVGEGDETPSDITGGDSGVESLGDAPAVGFPFDSPEQVFEISLDLPPESVDATGFKTPYVMGTLHVGELSTEVGVRLKGSSTFDNPDKKPSLKPAFDAFTPGHRFLGMEHLTLNAMKFDRSMMREAIAYHVFGELDVPAPRQGYTTLAINGEP